MTRFRTCCGFGLFLAFAVVPNLFGQASCDLDARTRSTAALPVLSAGQMPAALAAEITLGFDLTSVRNKPLEGQPVLRHALSSAITAHNTCAQAMAEYGLGQTDRALQLSEALPHFVRAQELLAGIGTPMALANVHERIASTQQLLGQRDAFMLSVPGITKEFRDAGDIPSAIRLQSSALLIAENGLKPAAHEALFHELETLSSPNVVGVRGYVLWTWGSSMRRTGLYREINAHFVAAVNDLTACDCQPQTVAAILLNRAIAADATRDGMTVLLYAKQADEVYRKSEYNSLRAQAMRLIGTGYAHQRDWPRAIAEYQAAIRMAQEQNAGAMMPNLHTELAVIYGDSGQPLPGLRMLDSITGKLTVFEHCTIQAQKASLEDQASLFPAAALDGQKTLDECREMVQPDLLELVDRRLADAQLRTGHTEQGLALAREAAVLVDKQRPRTQNNDVAMIAFNENQVEVYSVLIRALLQAGKPEEALLASEQSRARAFVDLTSTARLADAAATATATAQTRGSALTSEAHPFTLTAESMHSLLENQHATLVSYWIGEGRLYTWVLAPGKPIWENDQPIQLAQLASLVRATLPREFSAVQRGGGSTARVLTRGDFSEQVTAQSRKPWRDLYSLLIAPIAAHLPQDNGALLTFVPQGPLFQLSFAALLDTQGKYLVENYAINTTPSVGMLAVSERNAAASAALPPHYVVVANPEVLPRVNGAPLPPLPGTAIEAEEIARAFTPSQVTLLTGSHAGIADLEQALPQATVVHLATHAVVSDQAPSTSFLALDSRQSGGKLTMDSVYGLHLHAQLVVLSACSTGRGKITGDGVSGLSRAFVYAGTSSLVTTLWDVVDAPTAQLMPSFYAALAQGKSHSAALRDAQLQLIESLRKHRVKVQTLSGTSLRLPENPSYWAAFSLAGQP